MKNSSLIKEISAFVIPIVCLSVAGGLAVGHHLFYRHLNGQAPPDGNVNLLSWVGLEVSGQQINTSIALFLATLVKTFLGIAVGNAHDQLSWRAIKSRPTRLGMIDSLFSSRTGISDLLNFRLWYRYPATMLVATLYWLLPFSAIVTPTTLSIVPALVLNSTMMAVPVPGFGLSYGDYASILTTGKTDDTSGVTNYAGPLAPVKRAVAQSVIRGDIIPMTAPFPNSTYHVNFRGPALRCTEIPENSTDWKNVSMTISNASKSYEFVGGGSIANFRYLAWPGGPVAAPFLHPDGYRWSFKADSTLGGSPLSLTVVAFLEAADNIDGEIETANAGEQGDIVMINCALWNATYSANFSYVEGVQTVASSILSYDTAVDAVWNVQSPCSACDQEIEIEELSAENAAIPVWEYMAVLEAFQEYVTGSVIENNYDLNVDTEIDTQIGLTVLPFTSELSYVQGSITGLNGDNFVQDGISDGRNLSLNDALEGMFRNLTISLASEPALKRFDTPKDTKVTAHTYHNIYVYGSSLLWVAYGIAFATTAMSVVAGCIIIGLAKGAYSTKFSTILRVSHNVRLTDDINLDETDGKDPLPSRLQKVAVYFPPDGVSALLDSEKTANDAHDAEDRGSYVEE